MKHFLFTAALACGMAISLAGCSEDKTVPEPTNPTPDKPAELADYTIILYGTGGGNANGKNELDDCLRMNLSQVRGLEYTPKVHFTALVRYSILHSLGSDIGVTSYEWVPSDNTPTGGILWQQDNVRDEYYFMTRPENITAYINEQVKKYPAKKYIFLAWNHGGGFESDDIKTRTCMSDNVLMDREDDYVVHEELSIFEFEDALANTDLVKSGEKFEAVYTDMCLMGGIECVYQLQPYARYYVGAAHTTPGAGGDYKALITQLANCGGNTESALYNYTNNVISYWKEHGIENDRDFLVYDMNKLPAAVEAFAPIASKMASHVEKMSTEARTDYLHKLYDGNYQYDADYCYFDWGLLAENAEYAGKDAGETQRFVNALQNAQVAYGEIREERMLMPADKEFGLSICLFGGPTYFAQAKTSLGEPDKNLSYANNYPATRFDQTAQWSKFLMQETTQGKIDDAWTETDSSLVVTTTQYASYGKVERICTFVFDEDGACCQAAQTYQFNTIMVAMPYWRKFQERIDNGELIVQSQSDDKKKVTFDITKAYQGATKEQIKQVFQQE